MADKKKPDTRVPQPIAPESLQLIKTFMANMPDYATSLFNIEVKEVKYLKKLSNDDAKYVKDVISLLEANNGKVATNVKVDNIKQAVLVADQLKEVVQFFEYWMGIFERNLLQAQSYSYQHASIFETDIQSAIDCDVNGAVPMKELLESNRAERNAAAAATRRANAKQETVVTNS